MPNIRIDQEVYEALKKQAEPFVDTPNAVLRRLVGLEAASTGEGIQPAVPKEAPRNGPRRRRGAKSTSKGGWSRRRAPRAPAGSLLPEEEYIEPLLATLAERGGSAPVREVIEEVGRKLDGKLTPGDRETLASGGIRWRTRVQFVRLRLVEQGLLARNAPRGVWALTEAGRRWLDRRGREAGVGS